MPMLHVNCYRTFERTKHRRWRQCTAGTRKEHALAVVFGSKVIMHLKAGRIEVFVNKIVNEQVQITLWSSPENQFTTFLEIKGVTFSRFVAIAIKRKLFKDCLFKCVRLVSRRSNILSAFTYILSFYLFVESINIICSVTVPRKTVN